jgi:hypothetical protein
VRPNRDRRRGHGLSGRRCGGLATVAAVAREPRERGAHVEREALLLREDVSLGDDADDVPFAVADGRA